MIGLRLVHDWLVDVQLLHDELRLVHDWFMIGLRLVPEDTDKHNTSSATRNKKKNEKTNGDVRNQPKSREVVKTRSPIHSTQ